MNTNCGIEALHLGKRFADTVVFENLSFTLPAGETLAIIGASGCGKSTLLALLAGLETPHTGTVRLTNRGQTPQGQASPALSVKPSAATPQQGRIACILQDYGLFPWKTVLENLTLPLELQGCPPRQQREAATAMLAELGLSGVEQRYPVQLSGGQRQRVAIGRALITQPDILLMDEPFSSLDALTREHLQRTVLELWRKHRLTCILVTHSVSEALLLGQSIMVLAGRPAQQTLWLDNPCFGKAPSSGDKDAAYGQTALRLSQRIHAALGKDDHA